MLTDPIADMLTRIRNANMVYKSYVNMPASRVKAHIADLLLKEGFIRDYKLILDEEGRRVLRVYLKYTPKRERVIGGLKRASKPGLRHYVGKGELPRVRGGLGTAILSTSSGIITEKTARRLGVGGEVLCFVW
jgi:small subunit ribosomal protein S8